MSEHNCDGWDSCPNPAHRKPTLTGFLLARIAEDEAVARMQGVERIFGPMDYAALDIGAEVLALAVNPTRVLAECEAKRGLLTFALEHGAAIDGEFGCCHSGEELLAGGRAPEYDGDEFDPLPVDCLGAEAALSGLRLLALPYADHADYNEGWKP